MVVSGVVYTNIHSAKSTIEHCLHLESECIIIRADLGRISLRLGAHPRRFITYKAAMSDEGTPRTSGD